MLWMNPIHRLAAGLRLNSFPHRPLMTNFGAWPISEIRQSHMNLTCCFQGAHLMTRTCLLMRIQLRARGLRGLLWTPRDPAALRSHWHASSQGVRPLQVRLKTRFIDYDSSFCVLFFVSFSILFFFFVFYVFISLFWKIRIKSILWKISLKSQYNTTTP